MRLHESPKVPFSVLYTRFLHGKKSTVVCISMTLFCQGPKVIMHAYCLNREPMFFKSTWFLVDRFHWRNHKGIAFVASVCT